MRNEAGVGEAGCCCLMDWVGVEVGGGTGFCRLLDTEEPAIWILSGGISKKKKKEKVKSELSRNRR